MKKKGVASALAMAITVMAITVMAVATADAQSWQLKSGNYSLKAGESTEVTDLYWVINCRSQLTAPPQVTIMDGPPGVTVSIVEAKVLPRFQQCSKPVSGGKLLLKAEKVDEASDTVMTIRIKYKTKDGDRESSMSFGLALFP